METKTISLKCCGKVLHRHFDQSRAVCSKGISVDANMLEDLNLSLAGQVPYMQR